MSSTIDTSGSVTQNRKLYIHPRNVSQRKYLAMGKFSYRIICKIRIILKTKKLNLNALVKHIDVHWHKT